MGRVSDESVFITNPPFDVLAKVCVDHELRTSMAGIGVDAIHNKSPWDLGGYPSVAR
ncbi:hypothetical protein GCM10025778_33460 [Paeniglutamicibacter antarcticus]|uniref:Uncharacterized protein n=1 Tax=Paeniglutamicibacter antarcticus TaxID=494023 RepID=A0ABP9TSY2_9MICC